LLGGIHPWQYRLLKQLKCQRFPVNTEAVILVHFNQFRFDKSNYLFVILPVDHQAAPQSPNSTRTAPETANKMSTSDLDLLIEMGFPKERAEIAAKKGGCMFIWLFSQSILTHRRSTTSFTMAGG
jgi:hypothetical protein